MNLGNRKIIYRGINLNSIEIIRYTPQFLPDLKELIIHAENFGNVFLENELKIINTFHNSPDYGFVIIAFDSKEEKILGYSAIETGWRSLIIKTIITHHNYLRKGIGTIIINYLKNFGEKHPDINVIRVDTGDFMTYAQKFYLSNGFIISGHVSHDLSWNNTQIHFSFPLKGNKIG